MAYFESMIPFILHFAAGVYGKNGVDMMLPLPQMFEKARKTGWSNDPDDPGGATMIDVTLTTYEDFCKRKQRPKPTEEDLRNITFEDWCEILKTMYWDRWQADKIKSQGVAHILVDWVWASGFRTIRRVQKELGVRVDGKVGPETLGAINRENPQWLFKRILRLREIYYRQCPGAWKYLNGWLRRLKAIHPTGDFQIHGKFILWNHFAINQDYEFRALLNRLRKDNEAIAEGK